MRKEIKRGERTKEGSIAKVDFTEFELIDSDNIIYGEYNRISIYKLRLDKLINKHNHLLSIVKEVSTTPDEYVKNDLRTINTEDMRNLILLGCSSEINNILLEIETLKTKFVRKTWILQKQNM